MLRSFSPIQNQIISRLKNARSLRYSDLRPDGVANDLFNYHLQFLVDKGFVTRAEEGYSLGESGIKHVADPDIFNDENKIASLFKVNVITIVSRVVGGQLEILNQVRQSNPSYGKVGVMGGIVRKGEPLLQAATRKLREETGLHAAFRVVGVQRRMLYKKDQLFSDIIFPIACADKFSGELLDETQFGQNMWVSIDQAIKNDSADFDSIKKIVDVLKAIRDGKLDALEFFYEEDIQR